MRARYDRITTTIEREWLAQIIAGTKKIEYRPDQAVLDEALREGLSPIRATSAQRDESTSAEVTVLIHKIVKDRRAREYRLHIKQVLGYKHWDKRRLKPKR